MTYQVLTDVDLGDEYLKRNLVGDDAGALVRAVERWLAKMGLQHRDPFAVAEAALRLDAGRRKAQEPKAPIADPAEAARLDDLRQGIGDQIPDVSGMSMSEYAEARKHLIRRSSSGEGVGIFGPLGS